MSIKIKEKLKNIKDNQINSYQHLKQLVSQIALNCKNISQFEQTSFRGRTNKQQNIVFKVRQSYGHLRQYQTNNRNLLNKLNIGTIQQPQQPSQLNYIANIMQQFQILQNHGIGFGQQQVYKIYKSLCNLSLKKNTKSLRFWGKILGVKNDFYIAQGLSDGGDDGQLAPDVQPRGVGVNKYSYWATNSLTQNWIQLPLITPQQIQISRKIKYIFTGDLYKNVLTNPNFKGTEAHLLKCQIVRISTTCTIIPKGLYVNNADQPKQIQPADSQNFVYPQLRNLTNKNNWQYFNQSLLQSGRVSHFRPQGQQQQVDKLMKYLNQTDPSQPRLKNISSDNLNWLIKQKNLNQNIKTIGKISKTISTGSICIKNIIWPGWSTVAWQGKYTNIYLGYGHKNKFQYFPAQPQVVLQESTDRNEYSI